jgi:hypothetical protein
MLTNEHCIDDVIDIKTAAREAHARVLAHDHHHQLRAPVFAGSAMAPAWCGELAGASPSVKHFARER